MKPPPYIPIIGTTTFHTFVDVRYNDAKQASLDIWDNPKNKMDFEDVFHNTLINCLKSLDKTKLSEDELRAYFFKAFRINMIRSYGYAYNRLCSGAEIENMLIPVSVNFADRMDGFQMLEHVELHYGKDLKDMLWLQLQGYTYKELDEKFGEKNTYYILSKLKDELKIYYTKKKLGLNY